MMLSNLKKWIHSLVCAHPYLAHDNVGILHFCINRLSGVVQYAQYFPLGYSEYIDVTYVDFDEFLTVKNTNEALEFLRNEGVL